MTCCPTPTANATAQATAVVADSGNDTLERLAAVIAARQPKHGGNPETSYVARLLHKGADACLKKIPEEAGEVLLAAKDLQHGQGNPSALIGEVADLWFHSLIALAYFDLHPQDVLAELARREGLSGLEEKALRKAQARETGAQ